MSYADGLLSTGERIIHRNKQHPFIFIWGARWTILAVVLATSLLWLSSNMSRRGRRRAPSAPSWSGPSLVMYVGGIAVFAWTALRYVNQEYVLTNRRVIQVEGVLNRTATDSSLEKINDAVLSQSIFGRMFDFGDLRVLTAAEAGIENFRMIRGPVTFKKKMLDAKHEFELDMERAGLPPAPPIRPEAMSRVAPSGGCGRRPPRPAPSTVPTTSMRPRPSTPTSARTRSRGRSTTWPTCAIGARSRPPSTRPRRRSCSAGCRRSGAGSGSMDGRAATIRGTRRQRYPCSKN